MSATIKTMDIKQVDLLTPSMLMENDLIGFGGDIVRVISIESDGTGDNYSIAYEDDYGDKDVITFAYTDMIPLFVLIEDEE